MRIACAKEGSATTSKREITMMGRIAAVFVLAVAILCSGAAHAQGSFVQIYGTLLPFGEAINIRDATSPGLSPLTGGASQVPAARYTCAEFPT